MGWAKWVGFGYSIIILLWLKKYAKSSDGTNDTGETSSNTNLS